MQSILMIIGIFAGIAICMAFLYSVSQAMLAEGWVRTANLVLLISILIVMGALLEREVAIGRIAAVPMIGLAVWVTVLERGWYRLFPIMVQVFGALLVLGYVAFN